VVLQIQSRALVCLHPAPALRWGSLLMRLLTVQAWMRTQTRWRATLVLMLRCPKKNQTLPMLPAAAAAAAVVARSWAAGGRQKLLQQVLAPLVQRAPGRVAGLHPLPLLPAAPRLGTLQQAEQQQVGLGWCVHTALAMHALWEQENL
jgi:hypothetical protein